MRDKFFRLDANRRFAVLAIAGGLVLLGVFLMRRAATPDFVTLFRQLDLAEVGNITDKLAKASIPFRLGAAGSEVDVPEGDAARARVLLAKDGLPANGRPGLELFDKPSWGMTDFTQHITYRRALEGELARTIGTFKGVERAQVHLALPEASPLRQQQRAAEAAVVVSLRTGTTLSAEQVRGIAQLVSGSVEQMLPDHVSILDDTGRPLTGNSGSGAGGALSAHQADLQSGVEQHLAAKVEQLLASAFAPGDLKVEVAARLNFDQVERTVEAYDPSGKVLANEQRSQGGGDSTSAGDAGTIINNTYLNSRKIEKLVSEVGNVTRLTVSVMLNTRALKSDAEQQKATIAELVRNAVGIDTTRGDQVSVLSYAFTDPVPVKVNPADTATVKPSIGDSVGKFAMPGVGLVAIVVALILGLKALRPSAEAIALASPADAASVAGATVSSSISDGAAMRQRMQAELSASPDAAARVVRAWLTEAS